MHLRPAWLAAAVLAVAFGICFALSRWGAGGDHDLAALASTLQRHDDLVARLEGARRRDEAKRGLAAEVVAGRMTVPEAAEQFRRLNDTAADDLPRRPGREQAHRREVLDWAWALLRDQRRYAAAARWYAATFAAHPDLVPGPPTGHRFHAACAALQAGCGQGMGRASTPSAGPASAAWPWAGCGRSWRRSAGGWRRTRRRPVGSASAAWAAGCGTRTSSGSTGPTSWPGCPRANGKPGTSCGRTSRTRWPGPRERQRRKRGQAARDSSLKGDGQSVALRVCFFEEGDLP